MNCGYRLILSPILYNYQCYIIVGYRLVFYKYLSCHYNSTITRDMAEFYFSNIQWHIFQILTSEENHDVIYRFLVWIYTLKGKLHGGLSIWILFLVLDTVSHSFAMLTREISWSTLEINNIFPRIYLLFSMQGRRYWGGGCWGGVTPPKMFKKQEIRAN